MTMTLNNIQQAEEHFKQQGFVIHRRNFFSVKEGIYITTKAITTAAGWKYFEYSVFLYLDENEAWVVRVTPHGKEHKLSYFESLPQAVALAENILHGEKWTPQAFL